jgi:Na+/H+ antiporter NhaD/arsenite permease-like protein
MGYAYIATIVIFSLTYLALAFDALPIIKLDRPSIALIGAIAIVIFTPIDYRTIMNAINLPMLGLLFGMMIVASYLTLSGFFDWVIHWINIKCEQPLLLLALTVLISGLLSAFLINDIVCLALTPLIIKLCRSKQLPCLPFLLAISTAANIGSVATLTGNPQNMLIGSFCHIAYLEFSLHTLPIAITGLLLDYFLLYFFFQNQLSRTRFTCCPSIIHFTIEKPWLFFKTIVITLVVLILFFTKIPLTLIALAAAAILMLDNTSPKLIYALIDWPLFILFISLFILVAAMEKQVFVHWELSTWSLLLKHPQSFITIMTIIFSNLVSNVPTVLLFKPIILHLPNLKLQGINLAVMSTLAGNLTLLGSLANLIVANSAAKHHEKISFWQFFRFGAPLTLLTLIAAYAISLLY